MSLAEIYSYLRETYPELHVLHNTHISYLEAITERSDRTIFICKEHKNEGEYIPKKEDINKNSSHDLDLTGSPLKDICEIDAIETSMDKLSLNPWNDHEETFIAVDLVKARKMLCDYNFQKIGRRSSGSVWILCDATDCDKTIFLNIDFESAYNSRGIVFYKGCILTTKLNSAEMCAIHTSQFAGLQKIQTNIECFFNIKPNISLKLSWNTSLQNPSLNNFKSSEVILYQAVKVEESESVAEDFWRQLQILSIIKDNILEYKNGDGHSEATYRCGSGIDLDFLREKVMTIMTDLPGFYDQDNTAESSVIEAVIQRIKLREPIDVTDKLWELLKRCSCYRDLKLAFHYVFQCAATCNIVNMPNNQNKLAEIIREVSQRRLAIPSLVGSEPMELLLEIGIEKVLKDYESTFIESKICGSNDLKAYMSSVNLQTHNDFEKSTLNIRKSLYNAMPNEGVQRKTILLKGNSSDNSDEKELVGFQNSKFNQKEVECTLSRLAQIHLALEHLLLIQIHLNLENVYNQIFKDIMQNAPTSFDKLVNGVYDRIEIPLTTEKVLSLIANKDPHVRRIVMISESKFNVVKSCFYYNMENIFPPNIFKGIESIDEKEMIKENVYHHWYYLKIKSRRC